MNDAEFSNLQAALHAAMEDIFDAYVAAGRGPPDHVVDALTDIIGGSRNEFKKWFAKFARSKGSNLFFLHYPAFGEEGCEFEARGSV